jgi:branched-chain amino acid transport system ATP-binding protein
MALEGILTLEEVEAFYGHNKILLGITLNVREKEICGLAGRIGAGKTTTFKSILGLLRSFGSIKFDQKDILKMPTFKIVHMGIGYVPEGRRLYGELTVNENLEVARKGVDKGFSKIYDLFPELKDKKSNKAKTLSGGERQMLAIARALAGTPKLLLIEEPFEGLAVPVMRRLNQAFQEMKREGITSFIAESNIKHLESIVDRVHIIDRGRIIFSGDIKQTKEFMSSKNLIL